MRNFFIVVFIILLNGAASAQNGYVPAKVLGINDQNSLLVERTDRPGTKINIIIRGIQLARQDGDCAAERQLAAETRQTIMDLIGGENIILLNPSPGPNRLYAEADVLTHAHVDIAWYLTTRAIVAQPTDTGLRADWCRK